MNAKMVFSSKSSQPSIHTVKESMKPHPMATSSSSSSSLGPISIFAPDAPQPKAYCAAATT
jgi:hypothetical protein